MAISEVATIAVGAAGSGDASSGSLALASTNTTGAGGAFLFVAHEGAPTTYTWSDNKSTPGANFVLIGTINCTVGGGAGDMSLNCVFVHGPTAGSGHVFTVTLGAARQFRYGGGMVLGGTFDSTFSAATAQSAEGAGTDTPDAGSLVTSAAAYCFQAACNYDGIAASAAGTGWALKSNATPGRHFQGRNEASSGTFDPFLTLASASGSWITVAGAAKEMAGGGGTYNAVPTIYGYRQARKLLN